MSATTLLLILVGLTFAAALLVPERDQGGPDFSSYGTGENQTLIMYELATRMGWRTSRRVRLLDSVAGREVQVVLGPRGALGARETRLLLENVRRGGGLIFSAGDAPELADSLGIRLDEGSRAVLMGRDSACSREDAGPVSSIASLPPSGKGMGWTRPAPGAVTNLSRGVTSRVDGDARSMIAIGFPLGAGRVVALSSAALAANSAMRVCRWEADVVVARALEYVRPAGSRMIFDEYHHGFGMHGGSLQAVSMFLSGTAIGRFVAQVLVAAVVLLFAAAPRPVVPRDPVRVVRRSPLEHADALAHAYADVRATRTATSRLVGGLRRRAGRTVALARGAVSDAEFLHAVESRSPSLAPQAAVVRRALGAATAPREFPSVGDAITAIERTLLKSPPTRS